MTKTYQLVILRDYFYAGHCTRDGHNKVYAACLAKEISSQDTGLLTLDDTEVIFLRVHGHFGDTLVADGPQRLTMRQARHLFQRKCREKDRKGYVRVLFAPYVHAFGHPYGLALVAPPDVSVSSAGALTPTLQEETPSSALRPFPCAVKRMSWERFLPLIGDPAYGLTQLIDGERCLLVFDGQILTAYTGEGQPMDNLPAGAMHLYAMKCPFIIDGQRLSGEQIGQFVAMDVLELAHEDFTAYSYETRITTLQHEMWRAGLLIKDDEASPTVARARANSVKDTLLLLTPAVGKNAQRITQEVQASGGAGLMARRLLSDYQEGAITCLWVAQP